MIQIMEQTVPKMQGFFQNNVLCPVSIHGEKRKIKMHRLCFAFSCILFKSQFHKVLNCLIIYKNLTISTGRNSML